MLVVCVDVPVLDTALRVSPWWPWILMLRRKLAMRSSMFDRIAPDDERMHGVCGAAYTFCNDVVHSVLMAVGQVRDIQN